MIKNDITKIRFWRNSKRDSTCEMVFDTCNDIGRKMTSTRTCSMWVYSQVQANFNTSL